MRIFKTIVLWAFIIIGFSNNLKSESDYFYYDVNNLDIIDALFGKSNGVTNDSLGVDSLTANKDSVLVDKIAEKEFNINYTLVVTQGYKDSTLIVLANSTEIARYKNNSVADSIYSQYESKFKSSSIEHTPIAQYKDPPHFSPTMEMFYNWGKWNTGLTIESQYSLMKSHIGVGHDLYSVSTDFSKGYLFFGAGLEWNVFKGSLPDSIRSEFKRRTGMFGYKFSIGIPFFLYEIVKSPWPLGRYFWVEENARKLYIEELPGDFIKQFDYREGIKRSHLINFSHYLNFRLGKARYTAVIDSDVYNSVIHKIYFENIPAFVGSWGAGITGAGDFWVPFVSYDLKSFEVYPVDIQGYKSSVQVTPLNVFFHFRSIHQFFMGIGFKIEI